MRIRYESMTKQGDAVIQIQRCSASWTAGILFIGNVIAFGTGQRLESNEVCTSYWSDVLCPNSVFFLLSFDDDDSWQHRKLVRLRLSSPATRCFTSFKFWVIPRKITIIYTILMHFSDARDYFLWELEPSEQLICRERYAGMVLTLSHYHTNEYTYRIM